MICLKCKSNINDDANFCPICGNTIQHEQESAPVTPEIQEVEAGVEPIQTPQAEASPQEEFRVEQNDQSLEEQETSAPQPEPMPVRRPQGRTFAPPQRQGMNAMPPRQQAPSQRRRPLSEAEYLAVKKSLSTKTLIAFILSIFGICSVTFDLPCAIIGLVFSMIVRNEYHNRGLQPDTDLKLANVAFICSIVGLVIGVIMLILIFVFGVTIVSLIAAVSSMVSDASSLYGGF